MAAAAVWAPRLLLPIAIPFLLGALAAAVLVRGGGGDLRRVVEVEGEPRSVVWAVQLSDLHLSAFHPDRAADFRRHVGGALAMVNPSLVLITGDLTDAKSKDLLSSRQEKSEWLEYEELIDEVIGLSGLNKEIFYDLRGNHDSYGVPQVGGMSDFYEKHSINARLGRTGNLQSITLQNSGWKHLFVGFDSSASIGLRRPANIFGQPTDQLLVQLDASLSQWDNDSSTSAVTKYYQAHIHESTSTSVGSNNCSMTTESIEEFWEWEMGDWRSARSMRILAIDSGLVSYTDFDFRFGSMDVIIVPTFPLDSRFMQRHSTPHELNCQANSTSHFGMVRALIFSKYKIISVLAKVYDSFSGRHLVLEKDMEMASGEGARGAMYTVPWNWRAYLDESPDRYWLQIEAKDMTGKTYYSQLRPFSMNGLTAKVRWTWKEFLVMGCQWGQLYHPIMWSTLASLCLLILIPRTSLMLYENHMLKYLSSKMTGGSSGRHLLASFEYFAPDLSKMYSVWSGMLIYLLYLVFFPWFSGFAVTENHNKMYLYYKGWSTSSLANVSTVPYIGLADVMVIVLPHLLFVVLPAFLTIAAIAANRAAYLACISHNAKKDDDHYKGRQYIPRIWIFRCFRRFLILLCLPIAWKHWKHCREIVRAYGANPFMDAPIYCFGVPVLVCLAIYRTSAI
ncbi:putative metallophosphoesterase At3g03305 isoform X2 [Oryza brachyantha]|uniref:putative metallophosphoesterase At3g03305 isoform X2 n=1 Tax=Oryza brachyantha TaxID=4533 RepID=UPI00077674EB|nr:putative metallophosphoesterase At3g03305 isoform X2 [Oryza brachyantha]